MKQGVLNLPTDISYEQDDFIVTESNRSAFALATNTALWGTHSALITGNQSAGKTHLAHIFADIHDAAFININNLTRDSLHLFKDNKHWVVENIEHLHDEVALFHALNHAREVGGHLLMTSHAPVNQLNLSLPDLISRLKGAYFAPIEKPDDLLLESILMKLFADKQLKVPVSVTSYIVKRIDRSIASAYSIANKLDRLSLENRKNINIKLAKLALERINRTPPQ